MNCQDFRHSMETFLDGEFAEPERVMMNAHLHACARCASQLEATRAFRDRLKTALRRDVRDPSPSLRAAVDVALEREDRVYREGTWASRWLWRLIPAATAAALLIGVAMSRQETLSYLVEESIQRHRQQLPMDVTGTSPERLFSFFRDKVPFAVKPPKFVNTNAKAGVVFEGARLSNLRDRKAAYFRYRVGDHRLSVFVLEPDAVPRSSNVLHVGGRDVYWHEAHGYNVAMFVADGAGYAVASEMEPKRLVELISYSAQ